MSSAEEDTMDTGTKIGGFVQEHADLIVILLGVALFLCLCLLVVILRLCWQQHRAKREMELLTPAKGQGFRAAKPIASINRPPPSIGKHPPQDIFRENRPPSPALSKRTPRISLVDVNVHPPPVTGSIAVGQRNSNASSPYTSSSGAKLTSPRLKSSQQQQGISRGRHGSVQSASLSPSPDSSTASPPYATPSQSRSEQDDDPTSPRVSPRPYETRATGAYPYLPNTQTRAQQRELDETDHHKQQQHDKQKVDKVKLLMQKNVKTQTLPATMGRTADSGSTSQQARQGRAKSIPNETEAARIQDLSRHRCSSPGSSQPQVTIANKVKLKPARTKELMASFNDQHSEQKAAAQQQQPQQQPRPLNKRRPNQVSSGRLRDPSAVLLRNRMSTISGLGVVAAEFERSRKRSHSLPNLNQEGESGTADMAAKVRSAVAKASVSKAISMAGFNFVYSPATSRCTSPGIDEEVVGQYGAIMFSIRYDRFLQAILISNIRCSKLPERGRITLPDSRVKCRLMPNKAQKEKTRVVSGSRDPNFGRDVLTFRHILDGDAQHYSLLFEVHYSMTLSHGKKLVGQCLYHVAESPRLTERVAIFRNLEKPSRKYRRQGRASF